MTAHPSAGVYQLTLSTPLASANDVIPVATLQAAFGFITTSALSNSVVVVNTALFIAGSLVQQDVDFYIMVTDGSL